MATPAKKAPARRPQDHKPKTARPKATTRPRVKAVAAEATEPDFEFEHDGEIYVLPFAGQYVQGSTGADFMDAMLDESGKTEMRLAMLTVKAAEEDIHPDAYDALRSKPLPEFLEIVGEWLAAAQGVEPGESEGSST